MAIIYPLAPSVFADKLKIRQVSWRLRDNQQLSGMGSGQIIAADLAPRLWEADVTCTEMYHAEADEVQALIEALDGAINPFYLFDPKHCFPKADPDGSILGASAASIATLPDNNRLSLKGLPAGYVLSVGDLFAFDYASPARRALHRVCEAVTANASGVTPAFTVRPHIRVGVAVDDAVTLIKPAAKMIMQPGTFQVQTTGNIVTSQISFSAIQKL